MIVDEMIKMKTKMTTVMQRLKRNEKRIKRVQCKPGK